MGNPNPGIENLIPAKKGEVRNPKGKPKGTRHISTWIQDMLNDEEFETTILDARKGMIEYKGAPLKAIIKTAMHKAIHDPKSGNAWAEWLAKHGYGNKLIIETGDPVEAALEKLGLIGDKDAEKAEDSQSKAS